MLHFIDVIDLTTEPDESNRRKVSLSYSDKDDEPCLRLLGGLNHCTEITLDSENASHLIKFVNAHMIKDCEGLENILTRLIDLTVKMCEKNNVDASESIWGWIEEANEYLINNFFRRE